MRHTQAEAACTASAPLRRLPPTSEPGGRAAAEGSLGGAPCACAANSCHPVRNKSSKDFPKPSGEAALFIPFIRVASGPPPAAQVTASRSGRSGKGGGPRSGLLRAERAWALRGARQSAGREEAALTVHSGPPDSGARSPASREPIGGGVAPDCHACVVWGADRPLCGRLQEGRAWTSSEPPLGRDVRIREVAGSPTLTRVRTWPQQMIFSFFFPQS